MGEVMRVDPAALRDAGAGFGSLAASFDAALSTLLAALDAEAGCWGQDEIGVAFAGSYLPAVKEIQAAWAGLTRGVAEVGDAVVTAASNVDHTEARAQGRFGGSTP
jgi:uncharacterized protein YukE